MNNAFSEKRIPTLVGILLIIVGIATTSFLTTRGFNFIGRATLSETPENIRITNISDKSFTVSYITADKVLGAISFGTDEELGNIAIDDAGSQNGNVSPHKVHMITIKNLKPQTQYFFSIISGKTTFLNNEKPFTITTAATITTGALKEKLVSGKIVFTETEVEALVYITGDDSQTLVTRVNPDGTYVLSLSSMRKQDLASYASITDNAMLRMLVVSSLEQSSVTVFANQISPVPTIILSKNYDFTISHTPIATVSAGLGFPSLSASPSASKVVKSPQIITPGKNEEFTDQQPTFRGNASPSATVEIVIHSDEQIEETVTADKNGAWTFRPSKSLSAGDHTITITTRDINGITKIITQSFIVYAQGSQVNQSATPSATLVPSPSVTPSASLTPTPTPTPSPTPTVQPTSILTPTRPSALPTELPPAGNSSLLPWGLGGITTVITGLFLYLVVRGAAL